MKREEFLSTFGMGIAAVCVGGCLAACGKGDTGSPSGGGGTPPPSGVSLTINLATEITGIGESKSGSGIIVVRIAAGNAVSSFSAVQLACTHEGQSLDYSATQGRFVCSRHGSQFTSTGTLVAGFGPATTNLKQYTIAISGTTMTVTG